MIFILEHRKEMNMKLESILGGFATEMTDEQLEAVYGGGIGGGFGGGGFGGGGFGGGIPVLAALGGSGSAATSERIHSFGLVCDISIFSANLDLIPIVNIADSTNQICANNN
jgi:hypothetical protein